MRAWLVLVVALPLLAVGSGAGAGTSPVLRDNGLIAVKGTDGIYVVEPNGAARLLPGTNEATGEPAWSPDGSLLAVTAWDAAGDEGSAVYTMKPDGSQRRLVIGDAWAPSWAPDGKSLLVVRGTEGSPVLATVDVDGSDVEKLTLDGKAVSDVVEGEWSPDGSWLAVATVTGVQLVSANGEADAARSLSKSGYNLSWSRDSSKLAFDRYLEQADSARQVVVIVDVQTGKETILRGRERGATGAAWSPDGKQLAFLSVSPEVADTGGGCGGHQDAHLWVAAPDGTNAHQLAKGTFTAPPSWAPAQEQTKASDAAPTTQTPADRIPAATSDKPPTTEPKPAPVPARDTKPAAKVVKGFPASADGRIAARGADGIYLVSARRGGAHKLAGTAKMDKPAWSPDGRLIAVERADGTGTSVYTMRPDGSAVRLVLQNASAPAWSADGGRIFVTRGAADDEADVLLSVRPDGSDAHEVTEEEFYEETAWPADGAYLNFFTDEQADGLSLDSSAAAWSPDGGWLAFAGNSGDSADDAAGSGLWAVDANGAHLHLLARGSFGAVSWGAATSD